MTINPSAAWRVRPGGNNANGGGYDASISGAGTDYSQQDSAQLSGTAGAGTGTTNFQDNGVTFTSAMVGNAINIASGLTSGVYFVVAFVDAHNVTLDRSPGTATGAVWKLGGAWADFWTNTSSASAIIVPGNVVWILGSGMPNATSYTYDYSPASFFTSVSGDQVNGQIWYKGDPATPSGGFPCIKTPGLLFNSATSISYRDLWLVSGSATNSSFGTTRTLTGIAINCVHDQFGYDIGFTTGSVSTFGCEFTSSVAKRTTNALYALTPNNYGTTHFGDNIHDTIGGGISLGNMAHVAFCVIAKCGGSGIFIPDGGASDIAWQMAIYNNTIDNNLGHGIEFATRRSSLAVTNVFNNIISNHTASGKYGITVNESTAAVNDRIKLMMDYNTYYNNTTNVNAISLGANASVGGSNPFTNEPNNDWTLVSAAQAVGTLPGAVLPQRIAGWNG